MNETCAGQENIPIQGDLYGQQLREKSFKTWSTRTISTWRWSSIPTEEVGNSSRLLTILNGSIKDKCVDMVNGHVFVNESSHSSWIELFGDLWGLQEHELRGNSELIQYHTEIDIGAFWISSECEYDWQCISLMDEISIVSWSSDPVDKIKNTCIHRFRTMFGEDVW